MKTPFFAAAAVAALAIPALSLAAPAAREDTQSITVSYHDLNLATPAGHTALVARVNAAAADICGGRPDTLRDTVANQRFNACVARTAGAALAKVPGAQMIAGAPKNNG